MSIRVHAWVTSQCFTDSDDIERTIRELQAANVSVANIMLNDFSSGREAQPFSTFSVDKLKAMAAACHAAGIVVHATTWVMPHEVFVDGMLAQLPALLAAMGCTLLVLDAEEPWTKATGSFDYAEAAAAIARVFPRLGLSGIGDALDDLRELAKICHVWCPQAYATKDSQATPGGVGPYCFNCWTKDFGPPREGWIFGLAAYDQATPPSVTMQPVIDDMLELGIRDGCFWTINYVADRSDVNAFVASLSTPVAPPQPSVPTTSGRIFPALNIAAMTKGTKSRYLQIVQALLRDVWGVDPGPIDGLPGAKTECGVKTFQAACGLPETGVVDGNTWVELLSE
jgi:hypothetical protein